MLKLFNHYVPSNTVLQLLFDAMLLFVAVVAVFVLQEQVDVTLLIAVIPSAFAFAVTMMILNGALGLYRVNFGADFRETVMRVGMSIVLSIPVAYGIFRVLPWGEVAHEAAELNVIGLFGLCGGRTWFRGPACGSRCVGQANHGYRDGGGCGCR